MSAGWLRTPQRPIPVVAPLCLLRLSILLFLCASLTCGSLLTSFALSVAGDAEPTTSCCTGFPAAAASADDDADRDRAATANAESLEAGVKW